MTATWLPSLFIFYGLTIFGSSQGDTGGKLTAAPSYLITTPRKIRPNQDVQVRAHVFRLDYAHLTLRASIRKDDVEIASASETFTSPSSRMLQLKVPEYADPGNYTMYVQGSTDHGISAIIFQNETKLLFSPKQMSVFMQTDKIIYLKRTTVRYRVIAIRPNMLPVMSGTINVYVRDGAGNLVYRWLAKQLNNGVHEGEIPTTHPLEYGWWTIEAESQGQRHQTQFLIEDYYYTRYDINISMPSIIFDNEYSLTGVISVNETFSGMPVKGNGTVKLEIRPPDWKGDYPVIKKKLPLISGVTSFSFSLEEMRDFVKSLAGVELVVSATVLHWYIQEEKTAKAHAWVYSHQPYIKFLGGRVRTFKPGQPINAYIAIYQADGNRYSSSRYRQVVVYKSVRKKGASVETSAKEIRLIPDDSIVRYSYIPGPDDEVVTIRAAHNGERQDFVELVAHRHYTESNHYIHVTSSTSDPEVNRYMVFTVQCTTYIPEVHYQIVAGGNIVLGNTLFMATRQKTFSIALSRDMIPNARMLMYAVSPGGEILADSLTFHVKGIRGKGVQLTVNKGKDFSGDTVEFDAKADPGTYVSFTIAKYGLYRLGGHAFLTEHRVEEELLTYDKPANQSFRHTWHLEDNRKQSVHFNSPDMAVDPNTTFTYAGLAIFTDAKLARIPAAEICNFSLGYLPCFDGSCFYLSQQCDDHWDCEDGADEMGCEQDNKVSPVTRPNELTSLYRLYSHLDDATWAWRSLYSKPDGNVFLKVSVPLAPEVWVISALSFSNEHGLAFNEIPTRFDPTRTFFVVLELPKTAYRGEQIGAQVSLQNFWTQPLEVILTLKSSSQYRFIVVGANGIVSSYNPRTVIGDVQTMVYLLPNECRFIHFPILPTVLGKVSVTVTAHSFIRSQSVSKSMTVAMDGVTNKYHTPMLIDLINKGAAIIPDMWIPVPERFIYPGQREHLYVPGSQKATVTVSGDVVGPGFLTSWLTADNILGQIHGTGEQHTFNMGINVYWLKYLKAMNQLPESTLQSVLMTVNKERLSVYDYATRDGGMAQQRSRTAASVWITAMVMEVFAAAADTEWEQIMYIDPNFMSKMAEWMIRQQNTSTGAFRKSSDFVDDIKLTSNMTTEDGLPMNISLTSAAVVGLTRALPLFIGDTQTKADTARLLGADYIARHFNKLVDPFEICIATYALHLANHKMKANAFSKMRSISREDEYVYWSAEPIPSNPTEIVNTVPIQHPKLPPTPYEAKAIEGTSYALMVYLMNNWYSKSAPIMKWLQTRRSSHSGFDGVRDSLVATQALIAYATRDTNRALYNVLVNMESTANPRWKKEVYLKKGDFISYQQEKVPDVWGAVRSYASGTGMAVIQMTTEVNVEYEHQMRKPHTPAFSLEFETLRFTGRNGSIIQMNVCVKWLATHISPTSGSVIMEIDIPTGYWIRKSVQRKYQRVGRIHIKRARFVKKRQVELYIDYIDAIGDCFYFHGERWFPVANTTIQHKARIYDTSEPALHNTTLYTTYGIFHNHICQVCGSFQCPYCPFYNTAPGTVTPCKAWLLLLVMLTSVWSHFLV